MQSLLEAQRRFARELLDGGGAEAARLVPYRANVYGSWKNALAAAFPIVRKIVGDGFFDGLARAYANAHPSRSGDLNEYGRHLPGFLDVFSDAQDVPYLPDVARMEWFAHRAHFAANAAPFDFGRLKAVSPERQAALRPVLAPACALLASRWPLAELWRVHQDDYPGPIAVDLAAGPSHILVHRPRWHVEVLGLCVGDYCFLDSALAGLPLGDALQDAADADAEFDAARALRHWVQTGVVVRLEVRQSP
ncbi:MAG TPA: DNA-binding domain-containing protein [Burkholderiales bacterium]|nr:DNA-binding domain-containing protein [Burkholderiales bacterium]